jgi:hypothetical protein
LKLLQIPSRDAELSYEKLSTNSTDRSTHFAVVFIATSSSIKQEILLAPIATSEKLIFRKNDGKLGSDYSLLGDARNLRKSLPMYSKVTKR